MKSWIPVGPESWGVEPGRALSHTPTTSAPRWAQFLASEWPLMQARRDLHSPLPQSCPFSPDLFSCALCTQPLGYKVISVYMHCTLTYLSWKFQCRASFRSLGSFLIQIPFDSNSESVSWQGPSLPSSSLCSEVRNCGRQGQGAPEVSFGDRCCGRPLLCAGLLTTGHMGAFVHGLSRQSHTSGSILELSLCGPHLSSVSLSSKRKLQ